MSKSISGTNLDCQIRIRRLNRLIDAEFGHLAMDEVDIMASHYTTVICTIVELVRVGKRKCRIAKACKLDSEFSAHLPEHLTREMRTGDIFWAAFGVEAGGIYNLLYMSPHYLSGPEIERWAKTCDEQGNGNQ